jgi:hypothetical protein
MTIEETIAKLALEIAARPQVQPMTSIEALVQLAYSNPSAAIRALAVSKLGEFALALVARIRELEAALDRALDGWNASDNLDNWRAEMDAERAILEKGAVLP